MIGELYLIEFLHQTTTLMVPNPSKLCCILLNFYIKPQLLRLGIIRRDCCILLNFYIKPQREYSVRSMTDSCILLNFYIKPQLRAPLRRTPFVVSYWISTSNHNANDYLDSLKTVVSYWISTSNHNRSSSQALWQAVVSYWISTSNHNSWCRILSLEELYLIEFLHQTTTSKKFWTLLAGCILLNFYIKPQLFYLTN